jgi:plasmid stabilization system protein ParE
MVNIHWTNESEFWLKDIYDYIALDKKSIAKKVVTEIYQKV